MLKDEKALLEIHTLIHKYEQATLIFATEATNNSIFANRVVNQIKKYIRIGKEMRLNAHIGDYEMDDVILELGSKVNVLTKQT